MCLIDI